MDIKLIKQNYNIVDVISRYISLKRQGPEMVGNCIFHDDHHASMKISETKQIFKCFACDAGGDIYDFFTKQGYNHSEATNFITNGSVIDINTPALKPRIEKPKWTNLTPPQDSLPDVANVSFRDYGKPSAFWAYHNHNGDIIGYTCRFNLQNKKKDVIPYTYKTNGTDTRWVWMGFDKLRPLYN